MCLPLATSAAETTTAVLTCSCLYKRDTTREVRKHFFRFYSYFYFGFCCFRENLLIMESSDVIPKNWLRCNLCFCLMCKSKDPFSLTFCGHIFCNKCIRKGKRIFPQFPFIFAEKRISLEYIFISSIYDFCPII